MTDVPGAAAAPAGGAGTLTRRVLDYDATLQGLVADSKGAIDWAPLSQFVALDDFERVGTFLEVQNWDEYTEMLSRWAAATDAFETSVRRITESGALVYYEIEERHFRGGGVDVINSMTVFEFDGQANIRRLHVYLQQAR
jgi:hypothetical protein